MDIFRVVSASILIFIISSFIIINIISLKPGLIHIMAFGFLVMGILCVMSSIKLTGSMIFFLVLVLILSLILIYYAYSNFNQVEQKLKKSGQLVKKSLVPILSTVICSSCIYTFQFLLMLSIEEYFKENSYSMFLSIFITQLSFFIIKNFITVFSSSQIYLTLKEKKEAFAESIMRGISVFPAIVNLSFFNAALTTLRSLIRRLIEDENNKEPDERNNLLILVLGMLDSLIDTLVNAYEFVSAHILNFIGVYGMNYTSKDLYYNQYFISINANSISMCFYQMVVICFVSLGITGGIGYFVYNFF